VVQQSGQTTVRIAWSPQPAIPLLGSLMVHVSTTRKNPFQLLGTTWHSRWFLIGISLFVCCSHWHPGVPVGIMRSRITHLHRVMIGRWNVCQIINDRDIRQHLLTRTCGGASRSRDLPGPTTIVITLHEVYSWIRRSALLEFLCFYVQYMP